MSGHMMFDHLPLHIQETIFSRVRYVDLFETARVSQEWWTLTMSSYERVLHKDDDFLLAQVDFCNEVMSKEEPWQWWMLMEFTKSRKLHLGMEDFEALINETDGRLIKYYKDNQISVQSLRIDLVTRHLSLYLDQLFPDLVSLELNEVKFKDGSTVVLPLNLETVKFNCVKVPSTTNLSSMSSDPSKLKRLQLTAFGYEYDVYFDGLNCQNLTRLSMKASFLSASGYTEEHRILKSILNQNQRLKCVFLESAHINKEWFKMFPSNVVKLKLNQPWLSFDLVELLGDNVLYERLLMFYIFEEWKTVETFKIRDTTWLFRDVNQGMKYRMRYVCKPTANVEKIEVRHKSPNFALNDAILRNNEGIQLTSLKFGRDYFRYGVPGTVRNLNVDWAHQPGTLELEDPNVLETLTLTRNLSKVINLDDFPNMINLKKLYLSKCDSRRLACILASCISLQEFKLDRSGFPVFKNITSDIQSVSLKRLTMRGGSDTFEDILKHLPSLSILSLESHSETAILESNLNAISRLQYFKSVVNRNKDVAHHLSSLEFPYMVFACSDRRDFCTVSKGMELMNEISVNVSENNYVNAKRSFILNSSSFSSYYLSEKLLFVYTKNVPTRFLRTSGLVANSVHDFVSKYETININFN